MDTKIEKKYVHKTLGFPVIILNAPFRKTEYGWVLDIPSQELQRAVLNLLVHKPAPLTGNEVRFIRQYSEMTLQAFGERFSVKHSAVKKWEAFDNKETKMSWSTEKDVRLFVLSKILHKPKEIPKTYAELETKPEIPKKYSPVEMTASF